MIPALGALGAAIASLVGAARHRPSPTSLLRAALVFYLVTIPIDDLLRMPAMGPINGLTDLVALGVAGAAAYRWLTRPDLRAPVHPVLVLWVGLPGLAALTYGWSVEPAATFAGAITLFALMVVPVSASAVVMDRSDLDRLLGWLAFSGAIPGAMAVWLTATGRLAGVGSVDGRFAIVAGDFNHTASALMVPLAAAGTLALRHRPRVLSGRNWALAAAGLTLAAIAATASRGGLVGTLVVVVILVITRVRRSHRLRLVVLGLVALAPLAVPALGRSASGSTGRTSIFRIGLEACPQFCLQGSGLSTFPAVHERLAIDAPELGRSLTRLQAHNLWLGMSVEQGVVLMALWSASFTAAVIMAWRARHPLGQAVATGTMALLVTNLFLDGWEFKYFWLPLTLGVVAHHSAPPARPQPLAPPPPPARTATVARSPANHAQRASRSPTA